jgi:hypothetical protein
MVAWKNAVSESLARNLIIQSDIPTTRPHRGFRMPGNAVILWLHYWEQSKWNEWRNIIWRNSALFFTSLHNFLRISRLKLHLKLLIWLHWGQLWSLILSTLPFQCSLRAVVSGYLLLLSLFMFYFSSVLLKIKWFNFSLLQFIRFY